MATKLAKPVVRETVVRNPVMFSGLRRVIVTLTQAGVEIREKGKRKAPPVVSFEKIERIAWELAAQELTAQRNAKRKRAL